MAGWLEGGAVPQRLWPVQTSSGGMRRPGHCLFPQVGKAIHLQNELRLLRPLQGLLGASDCLRSQPLSSLPLARCFCSAFRAPELTQPLGFLLGNCLRSVMRASIEVASGQENKILRGGDTRWLLIG